VLRIRSLPDMTSGYRYCRYRTGSGYEFRRLITPEINRKLQLYYRKFRYMGTFLCLPHDSISEHIQQLGRLRFYVIFIFCVQKIAVRLTVPI
jgi:hypothetical protein